MQRITTTPFGQRPMTYALIEQVQQANAPASVPHLNKWELFRTLCVARSAFNVTDRDLTVLNALLSFHQDANLSDNDNLIVFPSNISLAERAHGMAESTLRRHLAALVNAGLILRHDSPNGKRYAKTYNIIRYGYDMAWFKAIEFYAEQKGMSSYSHLLKRKPPVEQFYIIHKYQESMGHDIPLARLPAELDQDVISNKN